MGIFLGAEKPDTLIRSTEHTAGRLELLVLALQAHAAHVNFMADDSEHMIHQAWSKSDCGSRLDSVWDFGLWTLGTPTRVKRGGEWF